MTASTEHPKFRSFNSAAHQLFETYTYLSVAEKVAKSLAKAHTSVRIVKRRCCNAVYVR